MHSRRIKLPLITTLKKNFRQAIKDILKEHHLSEERNDGPRKPEDYLELADDFKDFTKLPEQIQKDLNLLSPAIQNAHYQDKSLEIVVGLILYVAKRNSELVRHLNLVVDEQKFEKTSKDMCIQIYINYTLEFLQLSNSFTNKILASEKAKYASKDAQGKETFNIPAERQSQLNLIQNTINSLRSAGLLMANDEKSTILMGAMILVEKLIYDKYWLTSPLNSEVYKKIKEVLIEVDQDTAKSALRAFKNYFLEEEKDFSLLKDVDPNYLTAAYIDSFITSKVQDKAKSKSFFGLFGGTTAPVVEQKIEATVGLQIK